MANTTFDYSLRIGSQVNPATIYFVAAVFVLTIEIPWKRFCLHGILYTIPLISQTDWHRVRKKPVLPSALHWKINRMASCLLSQRGRPDPAGGGTRPSFSSLLPSRWAAPAGFVPAPDGFLRLRYQTR